MCLACLKSWARAAALLPRGLLKCPPCQLKMSRFACMHSSHRGNLGHDARHMPSYSWAQQQIPMLYAMLSTPHQASPEWHREQSTELFERSTIFLVCQADIMRVLMKVVTE